MISASEFWIHYFLLTFLIKNQANGFIPYILSEKYVVCPVVKARVKVRSLVSAVWPRVTSAFLAQLKMELNIFCDCSRQQQQQPPPSSSFWVLWFTWRLDNCPAETRISVTWAGVCWLLPSHPALKRNTKSPAAAPCPCPCPRPVANCI